jgi:O-antigen ligase
MLGYLTSAIKTPSRGRFLFFIIFNQKYVPGLILLLCSFLQSFSSPPWIAAHSEFFAFLAVLIYGCCFARHTKAVQIHLNIPIIVLLCLILIITAQYIDGKIIFTGDAIVLFIYIFLCIGALLIAQWHSNDAAWPMSLASILLITALASALIALIQALWVWMDSDWIARYTGFRRPGANLGQPNHLGTLLVMGAASLIYLDQRLHISRLVTVLLSLFLIVGMGITESRTGLLSGIALCLWWFSRGRVFIHPPRWLWIAAGVLILIAVMWGWPSFITYIQEAGPLTERVTINTTSSMRLDAWQQLWEAIWIKPWFGWGVRGVSTALNAVLDHYPESLPFTYAHNIIVDMAIGMGIPLTVFLLYAVVFWLWRRVKNVKTVDSWYAVGLLIPFGIHSLLEYPFAYAYFLVPAMLAIGMLEKGSTSSFRLIVSRKIIFGFFVLFGVLLTWMGVEYVEMEEDFLVARFESLNVGQTPADYVHPNILLLTQLKAMVAATRTTPTPHMQLEEIELLRTASLRFPWVPLQNNYALSLALNGSPEEAIRQLKVLRAMQGKKVYEDIKANWTELAHTKYPQLEALTLPPVSWDATAD